MRIIRPGQVDDLDQDHIAGPGTLGPQVTHSDAVRKHGPIEPHPGLAIPKVDGADKLLLLLRLHPHHLGGFNGAGAVGRGDSRAHHPDQHLVARPGTQGFAAFDTQDAVVW